MGSSPSRHAPTSEWRPIVCPYLAFGDDPLERIKLLRPQESVKRPWLAESSTLELGRKEQAMIL